MPPLPKTATSRRPGDGQLAKRRSRPPWRGPRWPSRRGRAEHLQDIIQFLQNPVNEPTGIDPEAPVFANVLRGNFPNPFNPSTTIRYQIKVRAHVSLKIYNAAGQLVKTLVSEVQTPTQAEITATWNGRNNAGQAVSSGVYFVRFEFGGGVEYREIVRVGIPR